MGAHFAHPDIAFEFGMWISPEFKIYLIKEFRRLKDDEIDRLKLGWNLQRTLAKINCRTHTDAIKEALRHRHSPRIKHRSSMPTKPTCSMSHCSDRP